MNHAVYSFIKFLVYTLFNTTPDSYQTRKIDFQQRSENINTDNVYEISCADIYPSLSRAYGLMSTAHVIMS